MSKKANPTVIGAFVVAAVLLGVAGILLLGGGVLFRKTHPYILYFQGDVNGLAVGSPVKFQGVRIGSVTSIQLRITPEEGATMIIPVTIALDESAIERKAGIDATFDTRALKRNIEQGLRGRLETESLVTGQRYIGLVLEPESPANLLGYSDELDEIPTLPSTIEQIHDTFQRFWAEDFESLVKDLGGTARGLRNLLESPEAQELPASFLRTFEGVDGLVVKLQAEVEPFGARVESTSKTVERAAAELELTLQALREAAERTREVEAELSLTLSSARDLLAPDAPLAVQLQVTLQEFGAAARSLRSLAELVERDPSALLRGKDLPDNP